VGAPVYRGPFDAARAERLLWRAGFGPRPGEAQALAKLGLDGAVHSLLNPGLEKLVGPKPHDSKGRPLAPYDRWGHDHCWWLDRMVRTSRPLVERMALVWHDWFATSNAGVGSQRLMLEQNQLFRHHGLGSFDRLLIDVTANPAMLVWLNGTENTKDAPNENYGREMMELFTLGADRGAYTEHDVREQARSLTGWTSRWSNGRGEYDFHFDATRHDPGVKTVFRHSGRFAWRDACRLCLANPKHAAFFTQKLWSYFVPVPPDAATQRALEAAYVPGYQVKPVLEVVLKHPLLHEGPRMTKPPVVHTAGLLRRIGAGVTTDAWAWIGAISGQQLFYPPNVAGWDETRWLDTATFRGRWIGVSQLLSDRKLDPSKGKAASDAQTVLTRALVFWRNPALSEPTRRALLRFAQSALGDAGSQRWKQVQYPVLVENALRQLIAVSPDLQTA
jgi:uncharacterized protein (DUF1800 family)